MKKSIYIFLLDKIGFFVSVAKFRLKGLSKYSFIGVRIIFKSGDKMNIGQVDIIFQRNTLMGLLALYRIQKRGFMSFFSVNSHLLNDNLPKVEFFNWEIVQNREFIGMQLHRLTIAESKLRLQMHLTLFSTFDLTLSASGVIDKGRIRIEVEIVRANILFSMTKCLLTLRKTDDEMKLSFYVRSMNVNIHQLSESNIYIDLLCGEIFFQVKSGKVKIMPNSRILINDYLNIFPMIVFNFKSQNIQSTFLANVNVGLLLRDSSNLCLNLSSLAGNGNFIFQTSFIFHLKYFIVEKLNVQVIENDVIFSDFGFLNPPDLKGEAFLYEAWQGEDLFGYFKSKVCRFVKFDEIPSLLIRLVVLAEDPDFYHHNGIAIAFIQYALNKNIRELKFSRGASTITMQLVRNLYLSKRKTLCRKISEIILAVLMENYFNVGKDNILEIYLNIIEFGCGIYGIQNASRYYFSKSLTNLTPSELIVLLYIIPRPKHFDEALKTNSDILKRNLSKFFNDFSTFAVKKGVMTVHESKELHKSVCFFNSQVIHLQ